MPGSKSAPWVSEPSAAVSTPATRPRTRATSVPVMPERVENDLPLPSSRTRSGASTPTGRRARGSRTRWPPGPSLSRTTPVSYVPRSALSRTNRSVTRCRSPGAMVKTEGTAVTLMPSMPPADTEYVAVRLPTLVSVRWTTWRPARSLITTDATLTFAARTGSAPNHSP